MSRLPWDEYFMRIAGEVSKRSTCLCSSYGAVITKDKHIVSTGYNGAPSGQDHCIDTGVCMRETPSGEQKELCKALHAEQNAILYAHGGASGGSIYTTRHPCRTCAKMIIASGITRVYYLESYPAYSELNIYDLFVNSGVKIKRVVL